MYFDAMSDLASRSSVQVDSYLLLPYPCLSWSTSSLFTAGCSRIILHSLILGPGMSYFFQRGFFFFLFYLGLHLQHLEVLGLGVELELQLPDYTTAIAMPAQIQAAFAA